MPSTPYLEPIHAWAFAIDAYDLGEGLVMYIGPACDGALLEVGVVEWYGEDRHRPRHAGPREVPEVS